MWQHLQGILGNILETPAPGCRGNAAGSGVELEEVTEDLLGVRAEGKSLRGKEQGKLRHGPPCTARREQGITQSTPRGAHACNERVRH